MNTREASRMFILHRDMVRKMLACSATVGYQRPKLEHFTLPVS